MLIFFGEMKLPQPSSSHSMRAIKGVVIWMLDLFKLLKEKNNTIKPHTISFEDQDKQEYVKNQVQIPAIFDGLGSANSATWSERHYFGFCGY